jgi:hypothetical protein
MTMLCLEAAWRYPFHQDVATLPDDSARLGRGVDLLIGVDTLADREAGDSPVRAQCLRAAQKLHHAGYKSVGLMPASSEVGVVAAGVNLALALAEISGSTVGYVDANVRWPALSAARTEEDDSDPGSNETFSTRWLRGDVALLVPRRRGAPGAGSQALSRLIVNARELFSTCLVDLTGWKRLGEHFHAIDLLDAIVVVAHAGQTTERELLVLFSEIPVERRAGVLLVGIKPGA